MNTVLETEKILSTLTRAEKTHALEWLVRDLSGLPAGIEKTAGVCGGSARIARTRIPVWTLEQYRRLAMTEAEMLRAFPTLQAADLASAWDYVRAHRAEIDEDIRQNETDDE